MHFDSKDCICTYNGQGDHACGQDTTLTCVWQYMGKNTIMCFHLKKKGSDRGIHDVGIKGYLYDMDFDMGKLHCYLQLVERRKHKLCCSGYAPEGFQQRSHETV